MKQWLARVAALTGDKHPEIRKAAAAAAEHMYCCVDAALTLAYITHAPAAEQACSRPVGPSWDGFHCTACLFHAFAL